MRRSLQLPSLSTLGCALVLAAVPLSPCRQPSPCPMQEAAAAVGGEVLCPAEATLDCCAHDRTSPGESSPAEAGQVAAAVAIPAPTPVAMPSAPPRPRPPAAPGDPDRSVPLYTLHATLLI